jgi:hypothetical protein
MNPYEGSINTGASAAAMGRPPTAADGMLPEATTSTTPEATFKGKGGYEYSLLPDGSIKIVKGNGANDGLVVKAEGKNAKAYAAIASEIGSQVTSPEQAMLLGQTAAKARAYQPPAPKSTAPKGPTAASLIAEGRNVVEQNQEAANRSAEAAEADAYSANVAAPTLATRLGELGELARNAGIQYTLNAQMAQSGSERARHAAEVAGKLTPEATTYLNQTYQTLKEHTTLSDEEAYMRAVSAASRQPGATPAAAPSPTPSTPTPALRATNTVNRVDRG